MPGQGEVRAGPGRAGQAEREDAAAERVDLRLLPGALAVWGAAACAQGLSVGADLVGAVLLLALGVPVLRGGCRAWGLPLLLAGGAVAVTALRLAAVQAGPVGDLADERAAVRARAEVVTDPRLRSGPYGDIVLVRATLTRVTGRGRTSDVRSPVLVLAEPSWRGVVPGQRVEVTGRLAAARGADLSGLLLARGPPHPIGGPAGLARAVDSLRAGLRHASRELPVAERSLVPALVDGDDAGMPDAVADDFRTTGLTHLLAVSGANLTLVLGFVLVIGRCVGVRARGLVLLGAFGVAGFVLIARGEPSVLRAAAMGVVALAGLGAGGRRRGARALCVAVTVLLLLDPWLARSAGFALSVLATAGILLLVPGWCDALAGWMPRRLAEALAVPLAAQLACTPVVAALSGQVSIVAVLANLCAAPAVAPATVLGLVALLLAPVSSSAAATAAWLAGRAAWWIVEVAEHGARLPGAATPWASGAAGVTLLAAVCVAALPVLTWLLPRRSAVLAVTGVLVVVLLRPIPSPSWPPSGWVMVACDVGQGDGLVLNAGGHAALVVDAGPDPAAIDRCLDDLDVTTVPLVVLSHLHADHAAGLDGVGRGRAVGEVEIGPRLTPSDMYTLVRGWARRRGVSVRLAAFGERRRLGRLRWEVVGPDPARPIPRAADESGDENNASLVLRVRTRGVRLLLTGDVEPEAQQALMGSGAPLTAQVLKVPHHGSRYQDPRFLEAVGAEVSVTSVGADNDYGHPAAETLRRLHRAGTDTYRTDLDGDVAVVVDDGGLSVTTRG